MLVGGAPKPEVGGPMLVAGAPKPEVGGPMLVGGAPKPECGGPVPEADGGNPPGGADPIPGGAPTTRLRGDPLPWWCSIILLHHGRRCWRYSRLSKKEEDINVKVCNIKQIFNICFVSICGRSKM